MRKFLILISILVVLGICVIFFYVTRFEEIPPETKIQDITVDGFSVKFFITEDNELYIGGEHTDSFGLYDKTGFRWSFMYAVRGILGKTDVPVLFAKNVVQVFEASDGFLFTDVDGTLYYFGSKSNGKIIKLAEDVICASSYRQNVYYVTASGDGCRKILSEAIVEKVASNVIYVYTNGIAYRIIDNSGKIYQLDVSEADCANTTSTKNGAVIDVGNDYNSTYILTSKGKLTLYQWSTGIIGGEENVPYSLSEQALLADMNFDHVCYFDREGRLSIVSCRGKDIDTESSEIRLLDRTDIIDIAVDYDAVYVLASDGSYYKIEIRDNLL